MDLLLTIHTALRRYMIVYQPEFKLRRVALGDHLNRVDARGRPLLRAELGSLLADTPSSVRQCAIVVPLRRQSVALLCDAVDDLCPIERQTLHPLPSLLAQQLAHGWIRGVYMPEDEPLLVLDLRVIAMHVVRQTVRAQQGNRHDGAIDHIIEGFEHHRSPAYRS